MNLTIIKRRLKKFLIFAVFVILFVWSAVLCKVDLDIFRGGISEGFAFLGEMFPPDFSAFGEMIYPAFETILIALLATFLGFSISLYKY